MARLRRNFQSGFVSGPLTATGTTATLYSPELANLPAVSGGDYFVLVLDPNGEYGAPEIVHLTAHDTNATSGTISRAQEGTVARVHPLNTRWINALSAQDLNEFVTTAPGSQTITGAVIVNAGSATSIPLIARGAASQTANLMEWQNSGNTVVGSVSGSGFMRTSDRAVHGSMSIDPGGTLNAVARSATERGLIVRAAATPTANLVEIQNSAAANLVSISAAGNYIGQNVTGNAASFTAESKFSHGTYVDPDTGVSRGIKVGAAGIAVLGGTKTDTLNVTGASTHTGLGTFSGGISNTGTLLSVLSAPATSNYFRAAATQTANILEIQNSAGTVLSRFDASGFIFEGANRVYSAATPNLDTTTPAALTFGSAGGPGSSAVYARRDHFHPMPATPVTSAVAGTGISVSAATGAVTIGNTGVLSVTASGNLASSGGQNPAITISANPSFATVLTSGNVTNGGFDFILGTADQTSRGNSGTSRALVKIGPSGGPSTLYVNYAGDFTGGTIVQSNLNVTGTLSENGVRVYSATTPNLDTVAATTIAYGTTAGPGTSTIYARRDHVHGTPATPVTSAVAGTGIGVSAATGAVTFTNTGVLTNVAGAGISVSSAAGNVTIGNTGVLSNVAGTNVAVSGATGNVTLSVIDAPTFAGLVTGANFTTAGTYAVTGTGVGLSVGVNDIAFTRASNPSYFRQRGVGGSLVFTTSNAAADDVTALTLAASGAATFGSSLTVTGASTLTGLTTATGGISTPADIAITGTGGQLNLSASGGTVTGTGTGIGDKINLYNSTYGFGIQTGRLVAYVEGTGTNGFSVRGAAGTGNKSSGTDAHTFLANGNATHTGTLTVNSTSTFTGRTTHSQGAALTAAAATVVLDVLGAASPTADLAQFRSAAGVVTRFSNQAGLFINQGATANVPFGVSSLAAASTVSVFRGAASQTGDLTQWQNSTPANVARVGPFGDIYTNDRFYVGTLTAGTFDGNGSTATSAGISSRGAGNAALVLRGVASQTADLMLIQNSGGTNLLRVTALGDIQTPNIGIGTAPTPATYSLNVSSANNDVVSMTGGGRTFRVDANGMTFNGQSVLGRNTTSNPAMLEIYSTAAATRGIYIQGAVGQTGNLLDLRNSDGVQVARIDAGGVATFSGQVTSNGSIEAVSDTPTTVTLAARGAVGQTANLTEWRNSAGSVLSYVASDGQMFSRGEAVVVASSLPADLARTGSANVFTPVQTLNSGVIIPNTVYSSNATGGNGITFKTSTGEWSTQLALKSDGTGAPRFTISGIGAGTTTSTPGPELISISGSNTTISSGATTVSSLNIRAIASQTGDLTQWQDSSGNAIHFIRSTGDQQSIIGWTAAQGGTRPTPLNGASNYTRRYSSDGANFSYAGYHHSVAAFPVVPGTFSNNYGAQGLATFHYDAAVANTSSANNHGLFGQSVLSTIGAVQSTAQSTHTGAVSGVRGQVVVARGLRVNDIAAGRFQVSLQDASTVAVSAAGIRIEPATTTGGAAFTKIWGLRQEGVSESNQLAGPIESIAVGDASLRVRAIASQTADLQQWQDSAGTNLTRVLPTGEIISNAGFSGHHRPSFVTPNTSSNLNGHWTKIATATITTQFSDAAAHFHIQQYGDGTVPQTHANIIFRVKQQAAFASNPVIDLTYERGRTLQPSDFSAVIISNAGPTVVELWMRAPSTFQSFAGFVRMVPNSGSASMAVHSNVTWQAALPGGTAQTASPGIGLFGTGNAPTNVSLTARSTAAGNVALRVGAFTGQTANIQEWTNSGDAVLASISAAGALVAPSATLTNSLTLAGPVNNAIEIGRTDGTASNPLIDYHSGATAVDYDSRISATGGDGTSGGGTITALAATVQINGQRAASSVLNVRAAASQTGNIATFQNSAGTELSSIGPAGRFTAPAGDVANPGLRFLGDTNTGIYRPAADTVAIATAGVMATQWDATNRQWQNGNFLLNSADAKIVKNNITGSLNGTNKIFDHIVGYSNNSANVTGAIQFTAPYNASGSMMQKLSIEGYTYDSNGPLGIELGFYSTLNTGGPPSIVNSGFSSEGSLKPAVRVGYSPAAINDMAAPTLTTAATGGTLADGTYNYRVSAYVQGGETRPVNSAAITTAGGNLSTVTVTWTAVAGATGYRIWRTAVNGAAGTELLLAAPAGTGTSYTDTGAATPAGAIPAKNSTMDNSKVVITLGDVNTVWQYPKFFITRAIATHGSFSDTVMDGWTSSLVTSFASIGQQVTVANKDGIFQNITVTAATAAGVPAIFRGAASQSGDLTQWQNSGSTTIASVTSSGAMTFTGQISGNGKIVASTGDAYLRLNESNQFSSGIWVGSSNLRMANAGIYVGSSGGDGNIAILGSADTTRRITLTGSTGNITAGTANADQIAAGGAIIGGVHLSAVSTAAANVPLAVRGAASQTGNLTVWQDSAGITLARMAPDGGLHLVGSTGLRQTLNAQSTFGTATPATNTILTVDTNVAGGIGIAVRRVTSQTANLMEWQDEAGTVLSRVANDGTIWVGATQLRAGSTSANSAIDTEILGYMGVF